MKNTPKLVNISEPLWRALEVMSEQMGVDKDALVNQAVYALARMHGFITPPQVKVNDEAAHSIDPIPDPMPSVKPGPPVPTPPEPPPTVPERGLLPVPPSVVLPPVADALEPPPVSPPAPAAAAPPKADAPQGPSESDRAEARARAIEAMKAIAAEVERVVAAQADPPIGDQPDEDEEREAIDDASEAESEENEAPEEQAAAEASAEAGDSHDAPEPDESEAPSEQNAAPAEEQPAASANGQAEMQADLESLGLGDDDDSPSDLSPLPELEEPAEPREQAEGIPTALVRPGDVLGDAATALRPKAKKPDASGIPTMGVHVNLPDRPDGAEEINVTGTVRRLALKIPAERDEEEPQERTQIVRKERARLYIIRGGGDPVEIVADRYLIGRGPHCDLVIESNRVSREHAAVFNDDEDGFVVEDLGSSNGTWFKEERVQKHVIADGDEVFFGNEAVRFTVQAPGTAKRGARRDGRVQA